MSGGQRLFSRSFFNHRRLAGLEISIFNTHTLFMIFRFKTLFAGLATALLPFGGAVPAKAASAEQVVLLHGIARSSSHMEDLEVFMVTGSNTTETHPVIANFLKRAVRKNGAKPKGRGSKKRSDKPESARADRRR